MLTKNDLQQIRTIVGDEVKTHLKLVNRDISTIKEDIIKIRKDQKIIVSFFDNEYLELRKRVERIEKYLKLASKTN